MRDTEISPAPSAEDQVLKHVPVVAVTVDVLLVRELVHLCVSDARGPASIRPIRLIRLGPIANTRVSALHLSRQLIRMM